MSEQSDSLIGNASIQEYTMLKTEQNLRIAMRDHLLYANLGVVGTVCYFAFFEHGSIHALLVIPWACFILGWTYLCNDEKVSNIREYIRTELAQQLPIASSEKPGHAVFGWEKWHRAGEHRMRFKITQLAVDITTFVLSGFAALCTYFLSIPDWVWWHYVAFIIALAIMVVLTVEFFGHFVADVKGLQHDTKQQ